MPLFAFLTGTPTPEAELALRDLQTWLDVLDPEEYRLLTEELTQEPTARERPLVTRTNAEIERLKIDHSPPDLPPTWGLIVKERL